jgi:hypothetical protein
MTSTGKMRDDYPIAIFRLEHVLTLFENRFFGEGVYLMPWAFAFRALFSEVISKRTRTFSLEVALLLLTYFEKSYHPEDRRKPGPFTIELHLPSRPKLNQQGPRRSEMAPFQKMTVTRGMSTMAALICALEEFGFDLPLDRLSSHPLENFFGLLRRLLNDCNMFQELLRAAARNCVVQRVQDSLGHPRDVCGRINVAGVVGRHEHGIDIICEKGPEHVFQGIIHSLDTIGAIDRSEKDKLQCICEAYDWIVDLHHESMTPHVQKGEHFTIRKASNSKIVASFLQNHKRRLPPRQ